MSFNIGIFLNLIQLPNLLLTMIYAHVNVRVYSKWKESQAECQMMWPKSINIDAEQPLLKDSYIYWISLTEVTEYRSVSFNLQANVFIFSPV